MKTKSIFITGIWVCLVIGQSLNLKGQVVISPLNGTGPIFNLDQLFDIQLVNTGSEPLEGVVSLYIEDVLSKNIVTVSSNQVVLPSNSLLAGEQIEWNELPNLGNAFLADQLFQTNRFPFNGLKYCYRFISLQSNRILGTFCFENAPLDILPPELLTPANDQEIRTPYPVLSWRPITPISGPELSYQLKLVALRPNQSPIDAIEANQPLLDLSYLQSVSFPYPLTGIPLDTARTYAWQVRAMWNNLEIARTAVWRFRLKQVTPAKNEKESKQHVYRLLKRTMSSTPYSCRDSLYFAYDNTNRERELEFDVYTVKNRSRVTGTWANVPLATGRNQIALDVSDKRLFQQGESYLLEVKSARNERFYLHFLKVEN